MGALTERTRWHIAHLLDRLPGQCWANLASWAIDGPAACRRRGDSPLPWRPIDNMCRSISPPNDRCYCGKVRAAPVEHDDGDRPGDDDQWRRLRTQVPHIRRRANAEQRAEETRGGAHA